MAMQSEWRAGGWEAEIHSGRLVLTSPEGQCALVELRDTATGRNITGAQFRAAVKSAGALRACQVFWKLRAAA